MLIEHLLVLQYLLSFEYIDSSQQRLDDISQHDCYDALTEFINKVKYFLTGLGDIAGNKLVQYNLENPGDHKERYRESKAIKRAARKELSQHP